MLDCTHHELIHMCSFAVIIIVTFMIHVNDHTSAWP